MNKVDNQNIESDCREQTSASTIYIGTVRHRRFVPKIHAFTYKVFMVYLDLQEIDAVFKRSRWWSINRFNLAQYRRRDYFDGREDRPLYDAVADYVEEHQGQRPAGPIRMLTNLRYFGFIINPITCYYCFDQAGEHLQTIVVEVTNTPWRQRCHYILDVNKFDKTKQQIEFQKMMHVSPFQPMDLNYHWSGKTPGEDLLVHIDVHKQQQSVFDATMVMQRQSMTRGVMAKVVYLYPFMTLKVGMAIYWQAIKLVLKRIPFYSNPEAKAVTPGNKLIDS